MEELIMDIKMFKEDHPEVIITNEMIKDLLKYYIDEIIEEIRREI